MNWLVPLLTLIPLASVILIGLVSNKNVRLIKTISLITTSLTLVISTYITISYDVSASGYQFKTQLDWVPQLGISYHVGLDGIGVVMILLHAILSFCAVLVSFYVKERAKEYFVFLMLLIASIFGVFSAIDLFLMYVFYEMAVIPLYPMITIWGSKNKEYGALKLTLYVTGGAVLAFVGLLALYQTAGIGTFDLEAIKAHVALNPLPISFQNWVVPVLIVGFGIVASLWPFHSWSPIGYAAAPAAVSMLHAGVLKKIGIYAILRIVIDLFPSGSETWMPLVATLAAVNILYGAWAAMTQTDLKFVIGFASVSHMGYALLGLSALRETALTGVVFFMFAHGIMAALCFGLIGFIDHQTHTREIGELGGLAKNIPFVATCFIMGALASSGLPGFANFVSEIIIFFGSWNVRTWQTVCAVFGIIITATYMLRLVKNVFFGEVKPRWAKLHDAVSLADRLPFIVLLAVLLVFGFYPSYLLNFIRPEIQKLSAVSYFEERIRS